MKKISLTFVLICSCLVGFSQQQYQHSQYLKNAYLLNPAASGIYDYIDISIGARQQWLGFNNAPQTFYVSGHTSLTGGMPKYNPSLRTGRRGPTRTPDIKTGKIKHVVGGYMMKDKYGAFNQYNMMGTYAFHLPVMSGYNLSFGLGAGVAQYSFDQTEVEMLTPGDQTYANYIANGTNRWFGDLSAGLWFYSNELFVGLSSSQIIRDYLSFGAASFADYELKNHYKATAGYKFQINRDIAITPAFLVKYMSPAPASVDFSVKMDYDKWLWASLSYRHQDAAIAMVGFNINDLFNISYSFDYTISDMRRYNNGGHELVLGVTIGR